jgi:hypothetical protein
MADLVEVPFKGGTIVFAAGSSGPRAYTTSVTEKAAESLEAALDMVKSMADAMSARLDGIKCNGAEASFGITVTGKGRFIVAEASAQASITVKLTFK